MKSIHHSVYIGQPLATVFSSLLNSDDWNTWFTTSSEIGQKIGAPVRFTWVDFGIKHETISDSGEVIALERPHHYAFTWKPGESKTSVHFRLTERGRGTVLSLTDEGYSDSPEDVKAFESCSVGWGEALTLFKFYLEHGITYGPVP